MSVPVEKTLAEIRDELFVRIGDVQEEYAAKGWLPRRLNLNKGVFRGLIELWAWGLHQLYLFLAWVLRQAFPSTATGLWLDLHCAQIEVRRREATKTSGVVHFTRSGTSGNVPIPAGRIVRTLPDGAGRIFRFVTTQSATLPDGQSEVGVVVVAEDYGQAANVTAGQISEIVTIIPGVDGVENRSDWLTTEGADEEDDDSLRARYTLKWLSRNGLTASAYESWALDVTGVESVTVLDQHPRGQGTVDVVIRGAAGLPTQELIDAVAARIEQDRPMNDDVLVKAPTEVPVDIDCQLELVEGDAAIIQAEAENRLRALFQDVEGVSVTRIAVGEDLTRDRMVAVLMAVSGVKRVFWTLPASDVVVAQDGLAVLQTLAVSTAWASEA